MKKTVFKGAATALITPFKNNAIDYEEFGRLIDWQIAEGIDALVVCGTTGEAPTLSDDEKLKLFQISKEICENKMLMIAGTGSYDT